MTVSIWQADDTQPLREVDFLVVGAGAVGCAAAYFAAQAGRQVTITDMRDVALGASSRNAGFMITGLDIYYHEGIERYGHAAARELWQLSVRTHQIWRQLAREQGGVRIDECGSYLLAEDKTEAAELVSAARALEADKLDAEFIDGDPLGRGYAAAIRQPADAAVHSYELVQAVFRASGAELVANNEMYRLEPQSDGRIRVYTRQYRFVARHVMLCTNAWSPYIDPYFVDKVIPTRAQCLVTAPLPEPVINTCGYSDYGYMYYRMTFDNRLLVGGGRKENKALEHNTTDDRITDPVQRRLDEYLRTRFPDVTAPVERRWSGIMAFMPDGIPMVGVLPHMPGVGFCIACHGHGLAMGAGSAERAVDHLLTGANPGVIHAARLD